MAAFWSILSVLAYVVFGGFVGSLAMTKVRNNCHRWERTKKARETGEYLAGYEKCDLDDHAGPFFIGIFWPLAFPAILGVLIGTWLSSREVRAEKREARKQADHERKMAELEAQRVMTMESVKFLVENGIQADVPGLFDAQGGK